MMRRLALPGLAALALLIGLAMPASNAEAHGVRYHPAYGHLVGGVVVRTSTTIVIHQEVEVVQAVHYAYRGHRYALGSGPLWAHHLDYCTHRFRSYNPHTNLFLAYSGGYHHCRSPYIQ
jgi:hypothetical protein